MRLINADAKTFPTPYKINDTEHAKGWNSCLNSISQRPTVDAEPARHGHWIWNKDHWECSVCYGNRFHDLALGVDAMYCGRCGAKMDEVIE